MSEYISLEQYNTYRIKSYAKHVYFPSNEQQLLEIINKHNQVFFLGNGSNIIFSKEYYDDVAFVVFVRILTRILLEVIVLMCRQVLCCKILP